MDFGVDKLTVQGYFEAPSTRRNQCERFNVLLEGFQDLVRQTDGLVFVASLRAVFDLQFHCSLLLCGFDGFQE